MTAPAFAWAESLGLPAASLQFLRRAQPHGDGPVRSVLFGGERFAEHGASLAAAQRVLAPARHASPFFPRLDENIALWRTAIRVLRERGAVSGADPAQAWLLDNAMLIDVQFDQVRQDLPNRYFERLPRLADAPLTGLPRVYGVAWAWVAHADSTLEAGLLRRFLGAYQATDMLALREMWALPASLRVVLVENLRRLAERTLLRQIARDAADQFAHGLADDSPDPTATLHLIDASWSARSGGDAFALQLSQHVSEGAGIDGRDRDSPAAHAVRAWLRERLPNPATALEAEHAEGAADHQSIRNAIGTLRAIGALDWRTVFEDTHPVLRAMNRNPVFHAERADTQDRALHALEKLSESCRRSELEVAQTVLALCRQSEQGAQPGADPPRASAPLHWLRGDGRAELLRTLGTRASLADSLRGWAQRRVTPLYLGTLGAATAFVLWALVGPLDAAYQPFGVASQWTAALLALLPASEAVVALVNRLISESSPPRPLPRYAFDDALPAQERTLVVMPCMLVRSANVAALAAQLERHFLANRDDAVQYALLSDWADAPAQEAATDKPLLEQAIGLVEGLNERYPPPAGGLVPRFLLLHRRRRFSATEQAWIGWERKRGKLESLVARLAAVPDHADDFIDLGALSTPQPWVRHLVTLDGDTALPPGALRELVAVAAHPLNRPRCEGRAVVQGHGVFQPRVASPLPVRATTTAFHRMYAGEPGIDPYSAASSEIYQDLWSEGSYTGKGLIDVQAAARVLVGRLPADIVLSHDLIEGSLLRSAMVSDISVVEEAPMHHDVAAARLHRWARGDWQLMPFLARPRHYGLGAMHVWKMVDNLRRSLVAPAALVLLVASFAGVGLTPGWALLLVCATFGAGPLLGAVAAFAPSRDAISMRRFYRHAAGNLAYTLGGVLWHLFQLLGNAILYVDAASRALWRQLVSRRHLMQWTTMAATERAATTDWRVLLAQHRAVPIAAAAIGLVLGALRLQGVAIAWGVALPLLAFWALSPLAIGPASRPRMLPRREQVGPLDRGYLAEIARDIWQWYERWVTAEDHFLPPDNVQHDPDQVIASRTSPTNIGLYLLAVCCARRLGQIDDAQVVERLSRTLDTLDRLPRYRGHFFNWIDTRSLAVLAPPYVSTVDSGNLCAHLRVAAAACDGLAAAPEAAPPEPLHALAQRMRTLADAHDFSFLYDAHRQLLHIGLRADTEQLDQSHYDLLASEARLASLVGIAKGDLPARHWSALGRPFFSRGEVTGLKSWSGSMFEMLMPTLVLDEPPGSVLFEAAQACVIEHQRAARTMGDGQAPWGISECAHNARDHTLAYQYGPQGVAALALRETPASEHVIAPYATLMAAMICPGEAADNLRALEALGARNHGGFIEALDFSPARVPDGKRFMTVGTWMSHHQGMAFVALTDVLADGAPRQWAAADPQLAACRWLLHERAPHEVPPLIEPERSEVTTVAPPERFVALLDAPQHGTLPATLWLGNGRHGVMLREYGSGVSLWASQSGERLVSRWRDDLPQDLNGHFFWLRDLQPGDAPSRWLTLTARPAPGLLWHYHARFRPDAAEFDAEGDGLRCRTEVWVAAEDDVELRRVTIANRSTRARVLSLVSAFEVTLAAAKADEAHPAFSNLFVSAAWDARTRALHLARTPRTEHESATHALHALVSIKAERGASVAPPLAMADRARWLGRGGRPARPVGPLAQARVERATRDALAASGERSTGMDPMAWLQTTLTLPPGAQVELTFATAVAPERPSLDFLLDRLAQPALRKRTLSMAQTMATIRLHGTALDARTWAAGLWLNTLLSGLVTREGVAALPLFERDVLWRHGISGDAPIVLVRVADAAGLPLLRSLTALLDSMPAGPMVDVVVLDAEPPSYLAPVERALHTLAERTRHGTRCRLHVLREGTVDEPTRDALQAVARLRCVADGRPLATVLQRVAAAHREAGQARERVGSTPVRLEADDGTLLSLVPPLPDDETPAPQAAPRPPEGRFDAADGAFRFHVDEQRRPARAWVNVIANARFGTQVSEAGAGMTWAGNSRLHAITPWSNDALLDPPGEGLLLHDLDSGSAWLLGRGLAREVVHAPGVSAMRFELPRLSVRIVWTVDAEHAVKQCHVEFSAAPGRARRLRLLAFAMWQLGFDAGARQVIDTCLDEAGADALPTPVLYASQPDTLNGFGGATAWLALRPTASGDTAFGWPAFDAVADAPARPAGEIAPRPWRADVEASADRRLLFDAAGRFVMPHALDGRSGPGLDPAALLAVPLLLQPGQALACSVLLGHAPTLDAARASARAAYAVDPAQRLARQRAVWADLAGAAQVATPDPLFDALVNHWLPAQTLGCRLWARAGFYQAGGAFGFRDQLQDAMALVGHDPALLAAQIRRHAARQFVEGDVQHWWHEPSGAGVRTRFADDRLWLALALALYVQRTGDGALLDESAPFLSGRAVPPEVEDLYESPPVAAERASLYEHAARAVDVSLASGQHGLPLFGTGDWNDGMNRVGHQGRGESVWMGWFLASVIDALLPFAKARADTRRVGAWQARRRELAAVLDREAWDGAWYLRGWFDDGTPLGTHAASECRIDLIAQAWAVLSGVGDPQRARTALDSAWTHLHEPRLKLARLLAPPLQHHVPPAGYIQGYPRGVRENGGQYNHGAVWALMAFARLGDAQRAWTLFEGISPAHRAADPDPAVREAYEIEPYVLAGDVYADAPFAGRGGWSWYTGSAGWLLRAALESICGVRVEGGPQGRLLLQPCLPAHWPRASVRLRVGARTIEVQIEREGAAGQLEPGAQIALAGLASHTVLRVRAPAAGAVLQGHAPPADRAERSERAD